jgi:ABC-2 type transport system ATP-binding protein
MNAVELENVTKTFDRHTAVDGLSLKVPRGSVYGFIGPNGSGKTTTLRMIMTIFYADSGVIRVFGDERHEACTDRIGYLPEERGLYKKMKVRELLVFYASLKSAADVRPEVNRWLERLDLTDWADKKVETLSKGMSQKVQFIAAVASKPEMVILDEPFSGLDPVNTDVLKSAVLELRDAGTTVIFSTHDMNAAETMCDFIFMIYRGRKVLDGTLSEIQDQYGSDVIRLRTDGDSASFQNLPSVERIRDHGQLQELRLASGGDSQAVLAEVMSRARVRHFELARPSLHDIFVRIAGPEAEEAADA